MSAAVSVVFAPYLPTFALGLCAVLCVALLALSYTTGRRRGLIARALCAALFLIVLLNPSVEEQQRKPVPDVAVVIVDRSPSQRVGQRTERTDAALVALKDQLAKLPGLDVRTVEAGDGDVRETRLFEAADRVLSDVPSSRRAGLILITDGQVHDVPAPSNDYGPVQVLLTGEKHERDRRLVILEGPSYGIVGQALQIRYRVEDPSAASNESAAVTIRQDNAPPQLTEVPVNTDAAITVPVQHAGQNVVDISVAGVPGELTLANNRVPIIINGVRDRLRVLLISGQPYAGARVWRNLLKSDPGVDLVHFTILRQPEKFDPTPQNDLALIPFPFHELFQDKLYGFDLIIFDRYRMNHILPGYYFDNIARYVQDGGGLLVTMGPSYASDDSLANSGLSAVLSDRPTGQILTQSFKPTLTDAGTRHPVTQNLPGNGQWGDWLSQVVVTPGATDETLMTGADSQPLLTLSHVGKGRVAQLATDEIWLWNRGYNGGGPEAELLRRLAHWLMKEPALEENALEASAAGGVLTIKRHALTAQPMTVTVAAPDGNKISVTLKPDASGLLTATTPAAQPGVYTISDGTQERFALAGDLTAPEMSDLRTTPDKLEPLVKALHGSVHWLADDGTPDVRQISANAGAFGGSGWVGLRRTDSFVVTNTRSRPLLPPLAYGAALLLLLILSWWREGRQGKAKSAASPDGSTPPPH